MINANESFNADKIANKIKEAADDQSSRFDALQCYLSEGIRNAIKSYNANEAKMGYPPASHFEISVSLSWALGWDFSDEELDRIISDLLYFRNFDDDDRGFVESTPEQDKKEAEESLLRLVGRGGKCTSAP
jgi:hypothetical protein